MLRLGYGVNLGYDIFPPEATVEFNYVIPVIYDMNSSLIIGKAYLMRVSNTIVADLHITSDVADESEAKVLIQLMYPTAIVRTRSRVQNIVFDISIASISVGFGKNFDAFIARIGNNVTKDSKRKR